MRLLRRRRRLAPLLAWLVCLTLGAACTQSGAPPSVPLQQGELEEDERLPADLAETIGRVITRNQGFLGAHPVDFCPKMSHDERLQCVSDVESRPAVEIDGPGEIVENTDLEEGGREWPNAGDVAHFRRVRIRLPLRKGPYGTEHEAQVVVFDSQRWGRPERCVFPFEHWSWSAMDRPERFAQVPVGECDGRALTVTEYFLERTPDAAPVALRFLAEPEARAWQSRDPEQIRWDGGYTAGHPYAKYFLLDSTRWWRGGTRGPRRDGYAWALRIAPLSLGLVHELEKNGDAFLDVFEDASQIELTSVSKKGLEALLAANPEVLVDVSEPGDGGPRFAAPPG